MLEHQIKTVRRFRANAEAIVELLKHYRAPVMQCPCCGESGRFALFGIPPRLNARCTMCDSLERHRFLQLFFERNGDLVNGKDVLHFAPERAIRAHLSRGARSYIGCDLYPEPQDMKVDIEKLSFEDGSFDLIVCCHVIICVDDRKALAELYRVLRPGGVLLLTVPVIEGWDRTFEPTTVQRGQEAFDNFGNPDCVRLYGRDLRERVEKHGFRLSELTAVEPEVRQHGLLRGEKIFICTR